MAPASGCVHLRRLPFRYRERRSNVKRTLVIALTLGLFLTISAKAEPHGFARQAQTNDSTDKTSPTYDMKAQALVDLQGLQKKYTELAEAIPADKFTWRPEPGARSVSELFLHVAAANYNIPTMMTGTEPAAG